MGPWPFGSYPLLSIGCAFSNFLFLVLITSSLKSAASSTCQVNLCSTQFEHESQSQPQLIRTDSNYHYCTVLASYANCIRATGRSCRGNLKFHSISTLVMQWFNNKNCSQIIAKGVEYPRKQAPKPKQMIPGCMFQGSHSGPVTFSHCGLFGDPHLRTFYDEFQTCRTLGAWPLIDNPYLAVQITNEPVLSGSKASGTTKVTVLVRDYRPCTAEKTYEAQTGSLPQAFVDGTRGTREDDTVFIVEKEPDQHIEIHARHISTHIIIRQVGKYLTFAIKIPQEIARLGKQSETLQLCVKGCPRRELIDYNKLVGSAMPVQEAVNMCRNWNVTDFYFDACVFDLLTTGDLSFSQAAGEARRDVHYLNPSSANGENRTYLLPGAVSASNKGTPENSAPGRPLVLFAIITCYVFSL
ncbi:repulsive guidance molecule A-like [Tachypleus tridentatus]|uniref:repulsive guidance molecule A-like n=1 Tax=Tachypleus tridentatus TaxID=6853 RepID=UPI003FD32E01